MQAATEHDARLLSTKGSPKFSNPPVVETVIGVQFPELRGFSNVHFGLYWEQLRDRYPRFQDKPRIPSMLAPTAGLHLMPGGTPDRVWFMSADEQGELIQLQPNRFHFNWRGQGQSYPEFETNSRKFFEEFDRLKSFCATRAIDVPVPEICEVTYFNHLIPNENETALELFGKALAGLRWANADDFLPRVPTSAALAKIFDIQGTRGKLHVNANLARNEQTKVDLIRLELTGRIPLESKAEEDFRRAIALAHEWVVWGFASVTDMDIQLKRWGRQL